MDGNSGGGKDQDATGYVSTAFDYPELCFGTTAEDRSVMYGEWTFMQFITDEFGDNAVRNLWDEIVNYDGFDALQHFFERYQTDIPTELARYRIKNLARDYQLAPLFHATVWLEEHDHRNGQLDVYRSRRAGAWRELLRL